MPDDPPCPTCGRRFGDEDERRQVIAGKDAIHPAIVPAKIPISGHRELKTDLTKGSQVWIWRRCMKTDQSGGNGVFPIDRPKHHRS